MALVDMVEFHEESDLIQSVEEFDNASIVIGLYLRWIANSNLLSTQFAIDERRNVEEFNHWKLGASEFCENVMGGKFYTTYLSREGLAFTKHYYMIGTFDEDLINTFPECKSVYRIKDGKASFAKIKKVIDLRFESWRTLAKN